MVECLIQLQLHQVDRSLIVNPRSAITQTPDLSFISVKKPKTLVNSTSDIDPTYSGEIKLTHPFGVQATRNFMLVAAPC